jgi:hypothetical protein
MTTYSDLDELVEDRGYEHDAFSEMDRLIQLHKWIGQVIASYGGLTEERRDVQEMLDTLTCIGATYAEKGEDHGLVLAIRQDNVDGVQLLHFVEKDLGQVDLVDAASICEKEGHKYDSESSVGPDSGSESHTCSRCGHSWDVTYY